MAQGVRFSSIFQRESILLKKWSSVISVWERSPWSCPDLVADHVFDDGALHHVWSRIFPIQAVISGWDHETTSRSTFRATVETWVAHYGRLLTAGASLYVNLKGYCSQMQTHRHYYDYFWWHYLTKSLHMDFIFHVMPIVHILQMLPSGPLKTLKTCGAVNLEKIVMFKLAFRLIDCFINNEVKL